jgi:protein ImuA
MSSPLAFAAVPLPDPVLGLEEVGAADPRDVAQAALFALSRLKDDSGRPLVVVTTRSFRLQRGRLSARGLLRLGTAPSEAILVRAEREAEALWAMEEALKSGAVCGVLGTVEQPSFVATRRLDFAARAGTARAALLRAASLCAGAAGDLSAARLRWRIEARPSAPHPFDPRAPGALRLHAALVRRRDGPPAAWELEQDHETHRLRLAAGLAGDGLAAHVRTHAAA